MLEEALKALATQAVQAAEPHVLDVKGPEDITTYITKDGTVDRVQADPLHRRIELFSISDIIDMANLHFDPRVANHDRLILTYSNEIVRLLFDSDNGREYAYINLIPTEEYKFLARAQTESLFEVVQMRHHIRTTLRQCVTNENLEKQVSTLAFDNHDTQSASASRSKESLGRSITKEVADSADLPDDIQTFNVRMFTNHDMDVRFPLTCILDPDPSTRRWFMRPLQDSMSYLVQRTMMFMRSQLDEVDEDVNIYQGEWRPSCFQQ